VTEPRTLPRRGVAVAAGILGMTAAVAMWASGEHGVQGKVGAVVGFSESTLEEAVQDEPVDYQQKTFESIDKDGDEDISVDELGKWLDGHGVPHSKSEVEGLIRSFDEGNGEVEFPEFRSHSSAGEAVAVEMDLLETFGAFDENKDGEVGAPEIKEALHGLAPNVKIDEKELEQIVGLGDNSGDGKIDYHEFKGLMNSPDFADQRAALDEIMAHNAENDQATQEEYKTTFDQMDKDLDGLITPKELTAWLHTYNMKVSDDHSKGMIAEVDAGDPKDGKVSLEEFKSHPDSEEGVQMEMELIETFNAFDHDESGDVAGSEIHQALESWGHTVSEEKIDEILKHADGDEDGKVGYKEFKKLMHSDEFAGMRSELEGILAEQEKLHQFNDDQYRKVFDIMDKDKDESITGKELAAWIGTIGGGDMPDEAIEGMIRDVDQGDNKVDFKEFLSHPGHEGAVRLEMSFLEFAVFVDGDQDGKITKEEIVEAMKTEGHEPEEGLVDKLMKEDKDGDGKLSYDEFKTASGKAR